MRYKKKIFLVLLIIISVGCAGAKVKPTPEGANTLQSFVVSEADESTDITITGAVPPTYTLFKLLDPFRLVVDIANTSYGNLEKSYTVNNGTINIININETGEETDSLVTRIEIGLDNAMKYEASVSGNDLVIKVSKTEAAPPEEAEAPSLPEEEAGGLVLPEEGESLLPDLGAGELPQPETFAGEQVAPPGEELPPAEEPPVIEAAPLEEIPAIEASPIPEELPPAEEIPEVAEAVPAPSVVAPPPPPVSAGESRASKILDIKAQTNNGATDIIFVGNGPVGDYNAFKLSNPARLVIDVWGVGNLYPGNAVNINTSQVAKVRIGQHPDKIRFVIDSADQASVPSYRVKREGNMLIASLGEGSEGATKITAIAEKIPSGKVIEMPSVEVSAVEVPPEALGYKKRYTGRKVSLDFKDADIHNILRLMADISGKNVIAGEDVKGKITVRMLNVPWDQALDVILESMGLGKVTLNNIIRIAPADKLRKEEEDRLAHLASVEEKEELVTKVISVNYATAKEMESQIKGLLSKRGAIQIDDRTNTMIIKDVLKNVQLAMNLIRTLDTPTPQVLIEARIVEATTRFTKDVGVQWGGGYAMNAAYGNPSGLFFPNSVGVSGGQSPTGGSVASGGGVVTNAPSVPNFAVNLPAAVGAGSGGSVSFLFGSLNNAGLLDLRLSALEATGDGKIISSPRIATLDNKQAIIKQGISIPYETVSQQGTQTQFIDATLSLTVTPHITSDRSVIMKIKAEKNAPDTTVRSAGGVPSISKKEATTEVLVKDGETTVIGGIMQLNKSESIAGVPWFMKIPLIGWLFKKKSLVEENTELIVFITPRIIVQSKTEGN